MHVEVGVQLLKLYSPLTMWVLGNRMQADKLGGKCIYLLGHLGGPNVYISYHKDPLLSYLGKLLVSVFCDSLILLLLLFLTGPLSLGLIFFLHIMSSGIKDMHLHSYLKIWVSLSLFPSF